MNADGLLADVIAHPDDDAPRLVYADWLLERGEQQSDRDRGEFIQLSCELAKLDTAPAAVRAPKVRRAMELLGQWELKWVDAMLAPLPRRRTAFDATIDWTWSRGFIEHYRRGGQNDDFRAGELERVSQRTPIRDVWVLLAGGDATRAFLTRPWLSSLRALSVEFRVLADALEAFFTVRALHHLRHLSLTFNEQRQIHVFAKHAAAFRHLESLELGFPGDRLERDTLQVIAELPFGPKLKHFGWGSSAGLEEMLELPFPLESLAVHGERSGSVIRHLTTRPRAFPSLRALRVDGATRHSLWWTFNHLDLLIAARGGFRELHLSRPDAEPGFTRVMEHPSLETLEYFSLSHAPSFSDREAEAIASATHLTRLRGLELSNLQISNAGAKALLTAPQLQRLRRFSLQGNHRIGAAQFASAKGFDELALLDLRDNSIPERGAAAVRLRKRFGAAARVGYDAPSSAFD